jgi:hypothetical protein
METSVRSVALLFSLCLFGFSATAAAEHLPDGSWIRSCRDGVLHKDGSFAATCLQRNGDWNYTQTDISDCRYVENRDGRLACGDDTAGSYQVSCRDIRYNGDRVEAVCEDRTGGWHNAMIKRGRCNGREDIINSDGRLTRATR